MMNATLLRRSGAETDELLLDEQVRQEARAVTVQARDRRPVGLSLQLEDGESIELPAEVFNALMFTLRGLTQSSLSMRSIPDELTTTSAAAILGVSRPTLMKMISSGQVSATKVGTHHRLVAHEVIELAERRKIERREAFEKLREIEMGVELS